MKIGIISDTHDYVEYIKKAIEYFNSEKVDKVFHAGDISSVSTARLFDKLDASMIFSYGNCDVFRSQIALALSDKAEICAEVCDINLGGKRILMAHKIETIVANISEKVDMIIHGHTHRVESRILAGAVVINPGECSPRKFGKSTVMVYDLDTGDNILKELKL